jgi:hypothetical protein
LVDFSVKNVVVLVREIVHIVVALIIMSTGVKTDLKHFVVVVFLVHHLVVVIVV